MEGMTTEEVCVLDPRCGICHWEGRHDSGSLGSLECNETTTCVFVFPGSGFDCGLYVCLQVGGGESIRRVTHLVVDMINFIVIITVVIIIDCNNNIIIP